MKPITIEDVVALSPIIWGMPSSENLKSSFSKDPYGSTMRQAYLQAYVAHRFNSFAVPNMFNLILWGFVALIVIVSACLRLLTYYASYRILPRCVQNFHSLVHKSLFLSATVGIKSLEPIRLFDSRWASVQVPLRIHGIIISVYVIANTAIMFTPYRILVPNLYYPDLGYPFDQYLRAFTDRAGIISFGSTPLVILLAGRNSPISAITGASYSTLQIYHRWVARITWLHAFFHGLGYTLSERLYSLESYESDFHEAYWNWGVAALVGGALLIFGSLRRLRELAYEVFLCFHICGAIIWIVGCYYHVYLIHKKYYLLQWIYSAVALWIMDRGLRFLRLLYLNSPSSTKECRLWSTALSAKGYVTESGDMIRVRIKTARAWPASLGGPGSFVFISAPGLGIFENHPFTITWPQGIRLSSLPAISKADSTITVDSKQSTSLESFDEISLQDDYSIELLIRPYDGFTKRLAAALTIVPTDSVDEETAQKSLKKLNIFVEGPYGEAVDLNRFQTILFISGGSGISATISHLAALAKKSCQGLLIVERIVTIWVLRNSSDCETFFAYLKRLEPFFPDKPANFVTIKLYLTKASAKVNYLGEQCSEKTEIKSIKSHVMAFESLNFVNCSSHYGRPDIGPNIDDLLEYAHDGIVVSVCGPPGLCDRTREAVRHRVGSNGLLSSELVYNEEAFAW